MIARNVNFASRPSCRTKIIKLSSTRRERLPWPNLGYYPRRLEVEISASIPAGFSLIDRSYESVAGDKLILSSND